MLRGIVNSSCPQLSPAIIMDCSNQKAFNLLSGVKTTDEHFLIVEIDISKREQIDQLLKQHDRQQVDKWCQEVEDQMFNALQNSEAAKGPLENGLISIDIRMPKLEEGRVQNPVERPLLRMTRE